MSLLLLLRPSSTTAAVCLNTDGSLVYKSAATGTDNKLYLNTGGLYARLAPIAGDKVVSISSGNMVAT